MGYKGLYITQTCYPDAENMYVKCIAKLGFVGVIPIIFIQNIYCGYSLEPLHTTMYDLSENIRNNQNFPMKFSFFFFFFFFFFGKKSLFIAWESFGYV